MSQSSVDTEARGEPEPAWVATAYGAVEVSGDEGFADGTEILVVSTKPGQPLALTDVGARVWRRLVAGPVPDADLTEDERLIVREMHESGFASARMDHPARTREIHRSWLTSPIHELVYGIVQCVAAEEGVRVVFIKGPVQHAQGLRRRSHSGDVDVWVDPDDYQRLAVALEAWGWTIVPFDFVVEAYHALAMAPPSWACEIDLHFRFPGVTVEPARAFEILNSNSECREFAAVQVRVPTLACHAVLFALTSIRPEPGENITDGLRTDATNALRIGGVDVIEVATKFGSVDILRKLLEDAFPMESLPQTGGGVPRDWKWRMEQNRVRYHIAIVQSLSLLERPRAIIKALWPSQSTVSLSAARAGKQGVQGMRAYLVRIFYGLKQLMRKDER